MVRRVAQERRQRFDLFSATAAGATTIVNPATPETAVLETLRVVVGTNASLALTIGDGTNDITGLWSERSIDLKGLHLHRGANDNITLTGTTTDGTIAAGGFKSSGEGVGRTILTGGTDFTVSAGNPGPVLFHFDHKLATGDRVYIQGNTTTGLSDGWYAVTVVDRDQITLDGANLSAPQQDGQMEIEYLRPNRGQFCVFDSETTANNTSVFQPVLRIPPGERLVLDFIHVAKQETAGARSAKIAIASAADGTGHVDLVRCQANAALFLPCHINLSGSQAEAGADGLWVLLENVDTGGTGGDAGCFLQFNRPRRLDPAMLWKYAEGQASLGTAFTTLYAITTGKKLVIEKAYGQNIDADSARIGVATDAAGTGFVPLLDVSATTPPEVFDGHMVVSETYTHVLLEVTDGIGTGNAFAAIGGYEMK